MLRNSHVVVPFGLRKDVAHTGTGGGMTDWYLIKIISCDAHVSSFWRKTH
jgi:hypothetical protein